MALPGAVAGSMLPNVDSDTLGCLCPDCLRTLRAQDLPERKNQPASD
jgi:hypothetical protein